MTTKSEENILNSKEEEIDFIKIPISYIIFVLGTVVFFLCYFMNATARFNIKGTLIVLQFRDFVDINIAYLNSAWDVLILFYAFVLIPFILQWIIIIWKIIKVLWFSYNTIYLRFYFRVVRINLSIGGAILLFIHLQIHEHILNIWSILIVSIVLLLLNTRALGFGLVYDKIKEEEIKLTEEVMGKKTEISLTYFQMAFLVILVFCFVFYYSIPEFQAKVDSTWFDIQSDPLVLVIFITTSLFSVLWFLCSFLISVILMLMTKYKEKLTYLVKILSFIAYIYLITKIITFNIPQFAPEPYPSILGFVISIASGLLTRYSSTIMNWKGRNRMKTQ
jgi:hypothetical protein